MKNVKKTANTQPAPAPEPVIATEEGTETQGDVETTADDADDDEIPQGLGVRKDAFSAFTNRMTDEARDKVRLMGAARQALAEAADLYGEGTGKDKAAVECAGKAIHLLYDGVTAGIVTRGEISPTLGDIFGFKPLKDGKPGKTPAGHGEVIRKRLVRLLDAADYVVEGSETAFTKGLPADDVSSVLNRVETKQVSAWQAYELLGDIRKAANTGRPDTAFNPMSVAKLVEKLSNDYDISADNIRSDEALFKAYASLKLTLEIVSERIAIRDEADAAEGTSDTDEGTNEIVEQPVPQAA